MSTDKNYITDEELINDSYDNNLLNRNVMFFDNYLINFNGFDDSINILIDDKIPNELIKKYVIAKKISWSILSSINIFSSNKISLASEMIQHDENKNNKYINEFATNSFGEKYTPVEGFTERHINIVYTWINLHKENPLYLIFDWDSTLSVCEGFDTNYKLINDIYIRVSIPKMININHKYIMIYWNI